MGGKVLEYEAKDILRKGIEQGRVAGHAAGHAAGLTEKLITLISKKLAKGQSLEMIADALEESTETIEALIKEYKLG